MRWTKEKRAKIDKMIIKTYHDLSKAYVVHPTYWEIAKKAKCSITLVHKVIKAYKAQNKVFGLK